MGRVNGSRRDFIRTTAYVAPAILTLTASPAFAQTGSGRPRNKSTKSTREKDKNGVGNGVDPQPPVNPPNSGNPPNPDNPPISDGPGTSPGNPVDKVDKVDDKGDKDNRGGGGQKRGR